MYKIIGGDKKEYGPVSAEQLRRWIAEGRLNAQSLLQAEGSTEWKPLAAFPEFADVLSQPAGAPQPAGTPPPFSPAATPGEPLSEEALLQQDYDLDIGSCISRAWALLKAHFWPVVGITTLIMGLIIAFQQAMGLITQPPLRAMIEEHRFSPMGASLIAIVSLLGTPVFSLLVGGLLNYYIRLIRGQASGIADAFAGFSSCAGQLILLGLVSGFLSLLGCVLCLLPGIYLYVSWLFAIPLVVDRRLNFWQAMEMSRKRVGKHWFLLFAFWLVFTLLSMCGLLACCIGVLVSLPLGYIAWMCAYEDLFSAKTH